jgi:hypothetical protein
LTFGCWAVGNKKHVATVFSPPKDTRRHLTRFQEFTVQQTCHILCCHTPHSGLFIPRLQLLKIDQANPAYLSWLNTFGAC